MASLKVPDLRQFNSRFEIMPLCLSCEPSTFEARRSLCRKGLVLSRCKSIGGEIYQNASRRDRCTPYGLYFYTHELSQASALFQSFSLGFTWTPD